MHPELLRSVIARCERRAAAGDCPVGEPLPTETLEDAVIALAALIRDILAADERGQGVGYQEAMRCAANIAE